MSAAGSLFARLYSGHTGVDPVHDGGLRHLSGPLRRRHLHRQGALRRRRVHGGARGLGARRTRCSRTTCSRGCTRGSRSSPTSSWSTTTRRACCRTRAGSTAGFAATGRSCSGCSRSCRRAHGLKRNTLPLIGRWKILDNLRRSLVAPTLLALLVAGWTVLPGPRWFWTLTVMRRRRVAAAAAARAPPRRARAERSRSRSSSRNLRARCGDRAGADRSSA